MIIGSKNLSLVIKLPWNLFFTKRGNRITVMKYDMRVDNSLFNKLINFAKCTGIKNGNCEKNHKSS